jgi:uncharacterized protein YndB with AHSA1/START domain
MDIHHANMIRNTPPERVYEALTQPLELEKWWGMPATGRRKHSIVEFHPGTKRLRFEIIQLERVSWSNGGDRPAWETQQG